MSLGGVGGPQGGMQFGTDARSAPVTAERRESPIDLNQVDPKVREAAEGIESAFVGMMLKAMRDTVPQGELSLDNSATEIYRSLQDTELAGVTARTQKLGIAEAVVAYLQGQGYTQTQGTGGTAHASQPSQHDRNGPQR